MRWVCIRTVSSSGKQERCQKGRVIYRCGGPGADRYCLRPISCGYRCTTSSRECMIYTYSRRPQSKDDPRAESPDLAWVFFSSPSSGRTPTAAIEDGRVGASHAAELVDDEWVFWKRCLVVRRVYVGMSDEQGNRLCDRNPEWNNDIIIWILLPYACLHRKPRAFHLSWSLYFYAAA